MPRRPAADPVTRHPSQLLALAVGLAGLALWRQLDTARAYGWLLAAGYGFAFLYGLVAAGNSDVNFLSLNGADNGLHLVSAAAGLAIARYGRPARARLGQPYGRSRPASTGRTAEGLS